MKLGQLLRGENESHHMKNVVVVKRAVCIKLDEDSAGYTLDPWVLQLQGRDNLCGPECVRLRCHWRK